MSKEDFLEKIRTSRLGKDYFFVVVGQEDDDYTIVVCRKSNKDVLFTFCYDEAGSVYRMNFLQVGFYELKMIVLRIDQILNEGEE